MAKKKLPTYHYLAFTQGNYIIIKDRDTGQTKKVDTDYAFALHEAGQLFNKRYGNDFAVDYSNYIEAIAFITALCEGFTIKSKSGIAYTATKGNKRIDTRTEAIRKFCPEHI